MLREINNGEHHTNLNAQCTLLKHVPEDCNYMHASSSVAQC